MLWCYLQRGAPLAGGLPETAPGGLRGARLAGRGPAAARQWPQHWAAGSMDAMQSVLAAPAQHQAGVISWQTQVCSKQRKGS